MFDMPNIHPRPAHAAAALIVASAWFVAPALGQDAPGTPDKSGYHLFNPTPRELMREMSTDRPDTTESAYTVDAGHVQLEMSLADFTYDRRNDEGRTRRTLAVAPLLFKIGLTNDADLQIGMDPHAWERAGAGGGEEASTVRGFGDTVVRLKMNLWGNDGGATALAVMPFVTFPTATDGLGSDGVEGGIIVPLAVSLPADFALGAMVEFDFNQASDGEGMVVDFVHTVTLGHDLVGDLAGYVEYAGFANLNRDEDYRGYFDAGMTYALTSDIQLDAGVRVGLTRAAEDVGVFMGVSLRF